MPTEETMRQLEAAEEAAGRLESELDSAELYLRRADDTFTELRAALSAAKAAEIADVPLPPDPPQPPATGLQVLARGPVYSGPLPPSRNAFHQLFTPGAGMKGDPWKPWSSKVGATNNAGMWSSHEGGIAVQLQPANQAYPKAGSSESHEAWVYFDKRYRKAAMELELKLVEPFGWPRTGKVAGIVGWNGDWGQWPGGFNGGPDNASLRLIFNDWARNGNPRLGAYVYMGGVWDAAITGDRPNYVDPANNGHSVEWLFHGYGRPRAGAWLPIRFEMSCDDSGRGSLSASIEGQQVLQVGNLPWFSPATVDKGWNTGYPCGLFGGNDPSYNPLGGSRTFAYRNLVWSGQ